MSSNDNVFRILLIDDTASIHEDFKKVLGVGQASAASAAAAAGLDDLESALFGNETSAVPAVAAVGLPQVQFEIDSAMQGEEGVELLRKSLAENKPYAMAFVDMRMPPGMDGVQTIRELWKLEPTLQVAICTAYSDYSPDQVASELKLDGRMLILRKPFDKAEVRQLAATLCEKWKMGRRAAELERLVASRTQELQHAAMHDPLTGLPNRLLFADRLSRSLLRARREPSFKFAVMFVDVDRFKDLNDSLGHEAGDALLRQVADRINGSIRGLDTVARVDSSVASASTTSSTADTCAARLGGDEFALIVDSLAAHADAGRVAQRILDAATVPYVINGHTVRCTVSIGIATNDRSYENPQDMIRDADTAMYEAKRGGRGRFVVFDPKMHENAVSRLMLENDLRVAIEQDHIEVYYQPIVEVNSNRVTGFEALARWKHATKGWIAPSDFIPMAEENGMIVTLGLKILEKACRQLAEWHRTNPSTRDLTMSVNLSRKQLANSDIVFHITRLLKETGLKPQNLKMEITESAVMSDAQSAVKVLKEIHALNIPLQMDDFGTGYSCLSCLQMFPLNGLKVDRGFVKEITERNDQATLLKAVVMLARSMGMPLVSEGVETPEQLAMLKSMGCEFVQGYYFAKPMDAASALNFVTTPVAPKAAAA